MANWNEDVMPSESNFPPQYESLNVLENFLLDDDIQQPSNMTSQNSHEFDPLPIQNSTYISDFLTNENLYSSNSFLASELPPKETPDWHVSPNLSNMHSTPFTNFSNQTSFPNGQQNLPATEAFFDDGFCKKDDYSLKSILEPWKNNGGGCGGDYTTTFGNTTRNLQNNSSDQYEKQVTLRNNQSYPFVDSLSSLNGATQRPSNPQEMKEAFPKQSGTVMHIGGTSTYPSGNNGSNGWVPIGEGTQRISSMQPSNNFLSYQNPSLVYSNPSNYTSSPQYPGARSTIGQTKSSLVNNPISSFRYSNSMNYANSPQYLGTRSIMRQTNTGLNMPKSSFGNQNNRSWTPNFDAGTTSNRSLPGDLTRGSGPFPRPSAGVNLGGDEDFSQTLTEKNVKDMSHEEVNRLVASYIRRDPNWWRKTDARTQVIFDKVFERKIEEENEQRKQEEKTNQRKRKSSSTREDILAKKEAAVDPTQQGTTTQNTSRGVVIKEGTQQDNDSRTLNEATTTPDLKGKGPADE